MVDGSVLCASTIISHVARDVYAMYVLVANLQYCQHMADVLSHRILDQSVVTRRV